MKLSPPTPTRASLKVLPDLNRSCASAARAHLPAWRVTEKRYFEGGYTWAWCRDDALAARWAPRALATLRELYGDEYAALHAARGAVALYLGPG